MRIALAVGACVLVGCGGGLAFDDFAEAELTARCEYYARCGLADDVADCRAYFARTQVDSPNAGAAIDAGTLGYSEDAAEACVDAYASLACDSLVQTGNELTICSEVFTGEVATGGACGFDRQCESDNCVTLDCPDACCAGTCGPPQALPEIGEPCTSICADGAFCNVDSMCQALLPEGAVCTDLNCARGLYCAGLFTSGTGTCEPLPRLGEACEYVCAEVGSVCRQGLCAEAGLPGDGCSGETDCSFLYACDPTGTCGALPSLGMPCDSVCADGAYCVTNTCVAQKANGAACVYNVECASHYCDDGTCRDVALCI